MNDRPADKMEQETEFAFFRLDELAVFPSVAQRFLTGLNQFQLTPAGLIELIETEPALTARLFFLAHQKAIQLKDKEANGDFDIQRAIEQLPLRLVRDKLLTSKIYRADEQRMHLRRQLLRHCIAVGCCAEIIAGLSAQQQDLKLFYYAGLLHDIGKLALDEVMPRSFARIIEQARKTNACLCEVEKKYLGTDHTILGKRLAEKWFFPQQVILSIWLHHFNNADIIEDMPDAKIAACVQAADIICRQEGIGDSYSYDNPSLPAKLLERLGINDAQIQQIRRQLPELVDSKCKQASLDEKVSVENFQNIIQSCTAQLAEENRKLADDSYQLQIDSFNLKFLNEFLSNIRSDADMSAVAQSFAGTWQKFYQTGLVCLYLIPPMSQQPEAVIIQDQTQETIFLKVPKDGLLIPKSLSSGFEVVDAYEGLDWLFEQLDVEFDLSRTIAIPVKSEEKVWGVLVFELRHPARKNQLRERFQTIINLAGKVFSLAGEKQIQQHYAELFSRIISRPAPAIEETVKKQASESKITESSEKTNLDVLAEMAAGAAHELNNPLLVISGRAQLLAENEKDDQKRQILKQIQKNAGQISEIVNELFSFAKPQNSAPKKTNIKNIIDQAVQLAAKMAKGASENTKVEIDGKVENVYVDSDQIITALSKIVCNSYESYITRTGPISIAAEPEESGRFIRLTVSDLGCGMDSVTIKKATYPFFSAKPAGRKRGMGLAIANRLIELNRGRLSIESTPGQGTEATILLPLS